MTRAERRARRKAMHAMLSRIDAEIDADYRDPLRGVPPTARPTWLPDARPLVIPEPRPDAWADDPDRTTRREAD